MLFAAVLRFVLVFSLTFSGRFFSIVEFEYELPIF